MTDARIEPYYLKEDMQYNRDTRYDNPYRTYLSSSSSQPIEMNSDIIRLLTSIDNGLTEIRQRVSTLEQIVKEMNYSEKPKSSDHFAEVSNMGSISSDDMKSCANCKKFVRYALDRNRGICQDNHMEVNTNFRGCVEWVSNTEAKI